jgi:LacI family repressor for deo operon, udp, cdd, tsx, nupC, and nupG
VAHDLGYRVLIGETQGKQERLDYYADMVQTRVADGLILLGSLMPRIVTNALDSGQKEPPIPMVLACEHFEPLECPKVVIDNIAAAHLAVSHLIESGRRRIATITGPLDNPLTVDRLQGYRDALDRPGCPSARIGWRRVISPSNQAIPPCAACSTPGRCPMACSAPVTKWPSARCMPFARPGW